MSIQLVRRANERHDERVSTTEVRSSQSACRGAVRA